MSLTKLFLSGLLVAAGLILGAFTLHGSFDPRWGHSQKQAAGQRERPSEPKAINTFQGRNRFVAARSDQPRPSAPPPIVKASALASFNADAKAADIKPVAKAPATPAKKKLAEKAKQRPPQQASLGWPWNLFGN